MKVGRFEVFQPFPDVQTYFSTRLGGVSSAPFDSLNLGVLTDDRKENVLENRERLFSALKISQEQIVRQRQVHGDRIAYVDKGQLHDETDAMFTDRPNLFLSVTAADCVPILFFEPKRKIIGVIHAGWRGTEKQIAFQTIEKVKDHFQIDASEILAVIGPSISAAHYEVSEEVAEKFAPDFVFRNGNVKPHLDLWKANADQLAKAGVRKITVTEFCTVTHSELFFSHRGSGGQTGRMLGLIGLKEN